MVGGVEEIIELSFVLVRPREILKHPPLGLLALHPNLRMLQ